MTAEGFAMPANDRYYTHTEWLRVRHVQEASPKYVESFLHHEGLKCVTTGERYHLEPSVESAGSPLSEAISPQAGATSTAAVGALRTAAVRAVQIGKDKKILPDLVPGLEVRVVSIEFEMEPWRDDRNCELRERYARVFPGMRYGDLFFELDPKGNYHPAKTNFTRIRRVGLFWENLPEHPAPFEGLTPAQQEVAYQVTIPTEKKSKTGLPFKHSSLIPPEEEDLELSFAEGLKHFHLESLSPEKLYIFENRHSFLIVGDLVFYLSNLDRAYSFFSKKTPTDFEADGFSFRAWEGLNNSGGK